MPERDFHIQLVFPRSGFGRGRCAVFWSFSAAAEETPFLGCYRNHAVSQMWKFLYFSGTEERSFDAAVDEMVLHTYITDRTSMCHPLLGGD